MLLYPPNHGTVSEVLIPRITMACGTMCLSDCVTQLIFEKEKGKEYDLVRTLQFASVGVLFSPVIFYWYRFLDKRLPLPKNKWNGLKKLGYDQLIMSPIILNTFFIYMSMVKGERLSDQYPWKYIDAQIISYKMWPITMLFNFYFIPLRYQLYFNQMVAFCFNVILSYINYR
ncbi:hypothetical protein SNEBB_010522 [Seison nebaliae]|nr:hypothetical protein SNEBB_010522 [Seison nebaliae]